MPYDPVRLILWKILSKSLLQWCSNTHSVFCCAQSGGQWMHHKHSERAENFSSTSCEHWAKTLGLELLYDPIALSSSSKMNGLGCVFLCCCWQCPLVSRPLRLLCDDSCLTHTQKAFHSLFDQKPTFVVLQSFRENMFLLKKVECDDGLGCSSAIILHWLFCFDRQVWSPISTKDTLRELFFIITLLCLLVWKINCWHHYNLEFVFNVYV